MGNLTFFRCIGELFLSISFEIHEGYEMEEGTFPTSYIFHQTWFCSSVVHPTAAQVTYGIED